MGHARLAGRCERRVGGPAPEAFERDVARRSWRPGGPCSVRAGSNPGTTATRSARRHVASTARARRSPARVNRDYLRALGADPDALGIRYDVLPRPGARRSRSRSRSGMRPDGRSRRRDGTMDAHDRHGSSRPTRRAAWATSASCSTRAATRSTPRPSGPGRPSWSRPRRTPPTSKASPTSWAGTPPSRLAASMAGRGGHDRRGRPRPVWRGDARRLLGAVRDRAPSPSPTADRTTSGPRSRRRPGHRAAPRMVVVGAPRPAHRRPGLHGQLRPGGPHRGGGPSADPRGPRPVVGGRSGLVRLRGRRAVRGRSVAPTRGPARVLPRPAR